MNWLVLSYFLSLGTLSYSGQILDRQGLATFTMPSPSYQTTLGIEAQLLDNHLFIGSTVQTWENPNGAGFFFPKETFYVFNAGLRGWGFELGYRHECDHPVISEWGRNGGILSFRDEFYFSYTGKLKVF